MNVFVMVALVMPLVLSAGAALMSVWSGLVEGDSGLAKHWLFTCMGFLAVTLEVFLLAATAGLLT